MKNKPQIDNGLNYSDRFNIALKSYLELILNYGIIYFSVNNGLFNKNFDNILEAIYFSANTITLLGYGDIYPVHILPQLLSVFQIITGAFLLIVTFTIYVTLNFTDNKNLNKPKTKQKQKNSKIYIITQLLLITGIIVFLSIINH